MTQLDVDLARRITGIASQRGIEADPASVSHIELGLDTRSSATIAPVWAALLTGDAEAQGRGTPGDEIRDATGRVPNLWVVDDSNAPSLTVIADQDGNTGVLCVDTSAAKDS